MPETKNSDSEIIIAQNKEEWERLLFLLQDTEPNVFWINVDTPLLKKPLHDAITAHFPKLKPYDIYVNEKTESLTRILLWEDKDKIPKDAIIHIYGMEDAVKSAGFLGNVNFQRDSFFRKAPAHIIFWADFATTAVLTHKAYDFWSWIVFTFDFTTPEELLTARQKGFDKALRLEDKEITMPSKDIMERIRHLEDEWEAFLKSVNGKPATKKQMKDAVTIARALANECRDEGKPQDAIDILQNLLKLNLDLIGDNDYVNIDNELCIAYRELGQLDNAKEYGERALSKGIELYGTNDVEIATWQSNLAIVYQDFGDLEKAKELLEKALDSDIKNFGEYHANVVIGQSNLAMIYVDLRDLNNAKELMEKALANGITSFGQYHPRVAILQSNLAMVYCDLGDIGNALKLMEKALDSDIKNFGEHHSKVAVRYFNLAHIYDTLNIPSEAILNMQKAYEIRQKILGENHQDTQKALKFLQNLQQNEPGQTS